jgi:hypothetical protein
MGNITALNCGISGKTICGAQETTLGAFSTRQLENVLLEDI